MDPNSSLTDAVNAVSHVQTDDKHPLHERIVAIAHYMSSHGGLEKIPQNEEFNFRGTPSQKLNYIVANVIKYQNYHGVVNQQFLDKIEKVEDQEINEF